MLSGRLGPRACERVSNDGCDMSPARWVASDLGFSSYRRVVVVCAATLQWWVLHGGGPLGVAVPAPRLLYQRRITSTISVLARVQSLGGSCGCGSAYRPQVDFSELSDKAIKGLTCLSKIVSRFLLDIHEL
jgi:hypothetical protein